MIVNELHTMNQDTRLETIVVQGMYLLNWVFSFQSVAPTAYPPIANQTASHSAL